MAFTLDCFHRYSLPSDHFEWLQVLSGWVISINLSAGRCQRLEEEERRVAAKTTTFVEGVMSNKS